MLFTSFFDYAIDLLNHERVSGWVYRKWRKTKPVVLDFYLDSIHLGQVTADEYRNDLHTRRLHPSGHCGFTFLFPDSIAIQRYTNLHIHSAGGKRLCSVPTRSIPEVFTDQMPRIFFMHIPKTAGTSFNSFVRQRYPAQRSAIHIEGRPPAQYDQLVREKHYLAGHFRLETWLQNFNPEDYHLYTILRDPHRHLQSNFNWLRGGAERLDDETFLDHPPHVRDLARRLGGDRAEVKTILQTFTADLSDFSCELFDNRQTRHLLTYKPRRVSQADVHQAIANLQLFTDIGLTEQYESFLQRFCLRHNLNYIRQDKPHNRSRYRSLYDTNDPEMEEILSPLIRYDLQLYQAAAEMFSGSADAPRGPT